ncbi:glycosyltransferase [Parafilimonas terrae]|uniref:Glycosyltransferase involved in cell wall bisynthesis n=1 Tax=Parafilimonas terrae TaxID=1465490 RepID=A0A1I5RG34_9BACT|nr:glycosyltransferase [Parafilimonas terrae]SFP57483.1 Glycosyltransferase involved in cell wall bisynthesis [Parafilimonas terrae]
MIKVVHVTEAFEGGVIEFLRCLTNSTPDIEHTIIYGRHQFFEKAHKSFPADVKFIAWPDVNTKISPRSDIKALRHLIKILKNLQQVDVIHLHSAKAGILGRIAARRTGHKKVIYAPHGATFLRKDVSALARTAFATIEKAVSIFPAKVVGVSKSEADAYRRLGIRASHVNNGKFFPESPEKKMPGDIFTIVTTGRAMRQKNPALYNTIASAFTDNKKIQFIWIGDGDERQFLSSPNIKITGWVDRTEVENNLREADLYISTALWEGLSYAVLEAMSMRLPLLLTNCPGNNDLVENGINGFLYNYPAQAIDFINQYFDNSKLLRAHGDASYSMLQSNFSVEQMAHGYREVYASM